MAGINYAREMLRFVEGTPAEYRYVRDRGPDRSWGLRTFCGDCGAQITHTNNDEPDLPDTRVHVSILTLDDPEAFSPSWWRGGEGYKLSWVEVPGNTSREPAIEQLKEPPKWRGESRVPLIGPRATGTLGLMHLPRFWCEAVLAASGALHPDYYYDDGPFDKIVFGELRLDAQEALAYIRSDLPDLPTFERWIVEKIGGRPDVEVVERINARLRDLQADDGTLRAFREFNGIDDHAYIPNAAALYDLDDWGEFHRILTSGSASNDEASVVTGGCHCGSVRWRGGEAPSSRHICHCETCRRGASAPYVAWFSFRTDRFEFLKGRTAAYRYRREDGSGAERGFCARCGSLLTYTNDDHEGSVDVTICTADDPDAYPPDSHEWTSEKLSWVELWDLGG
jgi:hypothetical protein